MLFWGLICGALGFQDQDREELRELEKVMRTLLVAMFVASRRFLLQIWVMYSFGKKFVNNAEVQVIPNVFPLYHTPACRMMRL